MRRLLPSAGPALAIVAALALLGLLTYGLLTTGPDHTIDAALAAGQNPVAPPFTLDRLDGSGQASLEDYEAPGRGPELLGVVVQAVP